MTGSDLRAATTITDAFLPRKRRLTLRHKTSDSACGINGFKKTEFRRMQSNPSSYLERSFCELIQLGVVEMNGSVPGADVEPAIISYVRGHARECSPDAQIVLEVGSPQVELPDVSVMATRDEGEMIRVLGGKVRKGLENLGVGVQGEGVEPRDGLSVAQDAELQLVADEVVDVDPPVIVRSEQAGPGHE